jgi:hypothetical protein
MIVPRLHERLREHGWSFQLPPPFLAQLLGHEKLQIAPPAVVVFLSEPFVQFVVLANVPTLFCDPFGHTYSGVGVGAVYDMGVAVTVFA